MKINFETLDRPYLIGEIGINHNGDLQLAKRLLDAVFACGWHSAKFQKRTPELVVPEHQRGVMRDTPWGRMTYMDYRYRVEFGKKEYDYIDKYSREKPIDWTASVWDLKSLEFICGYEVPFLKIPSALLTNLELLRESAKSKIPLVVSTGMSTLEEVDTSINEILKHGQKPVIMHTNSTYPTPRTELNLSLIPFLKQRYGCIVGYSGHEPDLEPTVVAVALGAKVIERHITMSHDLWGSDHRASLEVVGMDTLGKRVRDVDDMMGKPEKVVTAGEIEVRRKLRITSA
jgi:N-acetylneuraminate synthase